MDDHEVDVRGEVTSKLDDGRLVVLVVQGQGEGQPHGRYEAESGQEKENLVAGPMAHLKQKSYLCKFLAVMKSFPDVLTPPFHSSAV